jgi:peptidyl-prolyl cis-trans isomerase D
LSSIKKDDGSLDLDKYKQLLSTQGMTPEIFENRMRSDIAVKQVVNGVTQSSVFLPAQMDTALDAYFQQREIQVAIFSGSDYIAQAKPSDEDVLKYFNDHKEDYKSIESADVEYVVLSLEAIEKNITVNESELKAYFDQNQNNLASKEERRASHILITAAKESSDADKAKAKEKALGLLEALKKTPTQFSELAKKNSQDPGSASNGGDLGFFAKGAMVKPFEEAAFKLKKGELSGVVESDFGFHIIQLTDIKTAAGASFQQIKTSLESDLKKQLAQKKYAEIAEQFTNMVYEQSDNLKSVAQKYKLEIQTANNITRDSQSGNKSALSNPNVLKAIFSAESVKSLRNTEAIEFGPNMLISARITKYYPPNYLPMEDVKPLIVQTVLNQKALQLAKQDGIAQLDIWKKNPEKSQFQVPVVLGRDQKLNLPANLVDEAMRVDPSKLPSISGIDLGAKGFGILKVNKVIASAPQVKTPELKQKFIKSWSSAENQAYFSYLKSVLKVSVKEPAPGAGSLSK